MLYRDYPVFALLDAYEYLDDAEREVNGFHMRGGLWHKRLKRVVTGSMTGGPTSSAQFGFQKEVWFLHRAVFAMVNGAVPRDVLVDHRDRDRSHNRVSNLRAATPSQNQMNRGSSRSGSLVPYIGVCISGGRFAAFVSEKSKPIYLGVFTDAREAAKKRDEEVSRLHGPYATLNREIFPELRN